MISLHRSRHLALALLTGLLGVSLPTGPTHGQDLYDLVIGEVERPLFKAVLDYTDGNQSQAAGILGINRGTLRKKLRTYSLIHR